jgi:hypothetical protein
MKQVTIMVYKKLLAWIVRNASSEMLLRAKRSNPTHGRRNCFSGRRVQTLSFIAFLCPLLAACRPAGPKLEYQADGSILIISADWVGSPGYPPPEFMCDHIPYLRVWGDGRVVTAQYSPDNMRLVKSGTLSPAQIQSLLQLIADGGFFRKMTPMTNPGGLYFDIDVNLKAGGYHYKYSSQPALYTNVMRAIEAIPLEEFIPENALLVTGPGVRNSTSNNSEWSTQYGYSLADAERGYWVTGEALLYLWRAANDPVNFISWRAPALREGDVIYPFALEIPGVSLHEPPYNCWGSTKTIQP